MQVKAKYNLMMANLFRETFCWLPLAHVLNGRVLVVHGGLFSKDGVTLDDIRSIDRYRCQNTLIHPSCGPHVTALLWHTPHAVLPDMLLCKPGPSFCHPWLPVLACMHACTQELKVPVLEIGRHLLEPTY